MDRSSDNLLQKQILRQRINQTLFICNSSCALFPIYVGKLKSPKIATLISLGEVAAACVISLNLSTIELPAVKVGMKYLEPLVGKYKRMTPKLILLFLNRQLKQKSSILASNNSNICRK